MADDEKRANKVARSVFNKRGVDLSMADLRVSHGICYIRGTIKFYPGGGADKEAAMAQVVRALRQQPEIRDVICEYTLR